MRIGLEFSSGTKDKSEVLSDVLEVVKSAKQHGLELEEVEIESDEKDMESGEDED